MRKANNKLLKLFKTEDLAKSELIKLSNLLTITKIAKQLRVNRDTVSSWLKLFGINKNPGVFKNSLTGRKKKKEVDASIDKNFISDLYYTQHKTQKEIADITGLAKWTIQNLFKKYNITPRKCRNKNLTLETENCLSDRNWLYDQYITKQKTFTQIGLELGVADVTVARKVEEFDIPKQQCSGNYIWNIFKNEEEAIRLLSKLNENKSLTEIAEHFHITVGAVSLWFKKFNIVPNIHYTSIPQKKVQSFLDNIKIPYTTNDRSVLKRNLEIDIYSEPNKIGIEVDGIHFHSELFVDKKYHRNKTELCKNSGIRLIHFYDTEIINKFPIVCSILSNMFGKWDRTVWGRNTTIERIPQSAASIFYDDNHIQGKTNSKYHYALMSSGKIVSVMSFTPSRFDKTVQFELTRFCSKINTKIVGGASKLFTHFVKEHSPKSIVSYADRRIFSGNLYETLGFSLIKTIKEDYRYIIDKHLVRKENLRHTKMQRTLPNYDPSKTEHQNALANNIYRIYDCGKLKYIWKSV